MSEQPTSLDSAIRSRLDDTVELEPGDGLSFDVTLQAEQRYEAWLATLKRRYPLESEKKLRERAAELACLNRRERRKVFKHSSMKLPRFMKIPKGK